MPSGFIHKSGPYDFDNMLSTASTAIARGDSLKKTSGKVLPQTTGLRCVGVAQAVKAVGDSATTAIQVLKAHTGRTRFQAYEKRGSGSLAATDEGTHCDVSGATSAMGFDSSGTDDDTADIYLDKVVKTGASNVGIALIAFADPNWLTLKNN